MRRVVATLFLILLLTSLLPADEGMWLFNAPPRQKIKTRYGFDITKQWLDHLRESSVRFNNGGSGSFVSADGLAFTNHHVGADCLQKLSTPEKDYLKLGYYARTQADEGKCPDLELNVLLSIDDVTARVNAGVQPGMSTAAAGQAQRSAMSAIEAECAKDPKTRCDVVTLYSGGMYHLYRYRKYTDVRIVFAPEVSVASFGGDPDNFEFPRYDLDICFFRVYENDKPVKLAHFLKWTRTGVKDGDLVFMSGHPGSTSRLNTMAEMDLLRDVQYPFALSNQQRRIKLLIDFSSKSEENKRIAQRVLYGLQNGFKALSGYNAALHDAKLMEQKKADEEKLRQQLAAMKDAGDVTTAWTEIGKAMQVNREIYLPLQLLERTQGFNSELAGFARTLVRAAAEKGKPNTARLREFRETALPSLEQRLFSPAPIYDNLEILLLTDSLTDMQNRLGADNEVVKRVLAGRAPADAAKAMIAGTKLKDVAERQRLYKGGAEAIAASDDPLIALMRGIDQDARAARQRYEDEVDAVVRRESSRIAQGRFKLYGLNLYPDATFTLRLGYGAVSGYVEDGRGSVAKKGEKVPFCTDIAGLFARSKMKANKGPWELPPTWIKAEPKVNKKAAMNCAATTDSIGGNSGSPMVDRAGDLVGINFDRNAQGLGRNFAYTEVGGRNVFVDARGILEALRAVYGATPLANELSGGANQ